MRNQEFGCSLLFLIHLFVFPCSSFIVLHRSSALAKNKNSNNPLKLLGGDIVGEDDSSDNKVTTIQLVDKQEALTLQAKAHKLREEANSLARAVNETKTQKIIQQNAKVDQWIEEILIQCKIDDNTELLNSVDQVLERLRDDRFSQEQVNKIFNRICETGPAQSRSNCSPLMSLLVDAVGRLDEVERDENPNKRWSGRVERVLRKRLFAMDWGMDIEDEDESANPWSLL
jgi:hypothetical protein